jgi:hypothetical protein
MNTSTSTETFDSYQSYQRSPYFSAKHSSYFPVYDELLDRYRGKEITFVEIGVLNGGSLFMWRDFFGPRARIIGIDLNPGAKRWEANGFEIHIGNQAHPAFWNDFFKSVGTVDVVLDDGGHTFEQQIVTVDSCIPHITDGGLMIVEDTHTSYFKDFGYPTKYSFIEWTKALIDNINSRCPGVDASKLSYRNSIHSIAVFESIVGFKINRSLCFESEEITNGGIYSNAEDFRHQDSSIGMVRSLITSVVKRFPFLKHSSTLKLAKNAFVTQLSAAYYRRASKHLKQFF